MSCVLVFGVFACLPHFRHSVDAASHVVQGILRVTRHVGPEVVLRLGQVWIVKHHAVAEIMRGRFPTFTRPFLGVARDLGLARFDATLVEFAQLFSGIAFRLD